MPSPTPYTDQDLDRDFVSVRPRLLALARKMGHTPDNAEDLVQETAMTALLILDRYDPQTGPEGCFQWLTGILHYCILEAQNRRARRVSTVPLDETIGVPGARSRSQAPTQLERALETLPYWQRIFCRDWLEGSSQREIAARYGFHRNTVGNRLELAFESLGILMPDREDLEYGQDLVTACSHQTLYWKPKGPWIS